MTSTPRRRDRRTPPTPEQVLAAVERAQRHRARQHDAATVWWILEHLDVRRRSRVAQHVRATLLALEQDGSLLATPLHGLAAWSLSPRGRRRLARARVAGGRLALPESPQHRAWRNARTLAAAELAGFRRELDAQLERAGGLLGAQPPADSDTWFELAERLRAAAWRLGSALHCVHEWQEPDDARADIDDHDAEADALLPAQERAQRRARRIGRRNVTLWRTP